MLTRLLFYVEIYFAQIVLTKLLPVILLIFIKYGRGLFVKFMHWSGAYRGRSVGPYWSDGQFRIFSSDTILEDDFNLPEVKVAPLGTTHIYDADGNKSIFLFTDPFDYSYAIQYENKRLQEQRGINYDPATSPVIFMMKEDYVPMRYHFHLAEISHADVLLDMFAKFHDNVSPLISCELIDTEHKNLADRLSYITFGCISEMYKMTDFKCVSKLVIFVNRYRLDYLFLKLGAVQIYGELKRKYMVALYRRMCSWAMDNFNSKSAGTGSDKNPEKTITQKIFNTPATNGIAYNVLYKEFYEKFYPLVLEAFQKSSLLDKVAADVTVPGAEVVLLEVPAMVLPPVWNFP